MTARLRRARRGPRRRGAGHARPSVLVLELHDQKLDAPRLDALERTGIPVVVLGRAIDLNDPLVRERRFASILPRPVTLGEVADRVRAIRLFRLSALHHADDFDLAAVLGPAEAEAFADGGFVRPEVAGEFFVDDRPSACPVPVNWRVLSSAYRRRRNRMPAPFTSRSSTRTARSWARWPERSGPGAPSCRPGLRRPGG